MWVERIKIETDVRIRPCIVQRNILQSEIRLTKPKCWHWPKHGDDAWGTTCPEWITIESQYLGWYPGSVGQDSLKNLQNDKS